MAAGRPALAALQAGAGAGPIGAAGKDVAGKERQADHAPGPAAQPHISRRRSRR